MMLLIPMVLALGMSTPRPAQTPVSADPTIRVITDSARRVVRIVAGPFEIAPGTGSGRGNEAGGPHEHGPLAPFLTFHWPTEGWLRGVTLRVLDREGHELPRQLVHHVNVVNLGRRQLLYPAPERTIAMGQETEDIRLPPTVGIPMTRGAEMGLVLAWHNRTSEAWHDATVVLEISWLPRNTVPRPLDVLPVYMDVRYPVGQPVDFDLPAGPQRFVADFTMPIAGRIIGAGGHLHDYGTGLKLSEVRGSRERDVIALRTRLDSTGRLLAVDRKFPGIRGDGIRLHRGRTYRMTGSYENTTGETLPKGAMVHLILLFAPDDFVEWPKLNPDEPDFAKDLRMLQSRGAARPGQHVH